MSMRILILSDAHLFESKEEQLFGVNTFVALKRVTEQIKQLYPPFDLLIALGDLAEDGQAGSYMNFHELTNGLASESVWIKGNHDQFTNVPREWARKYVKNDWEKGSWLFIFLDTSLYGKDEGRLSVAELSRLDNLLKANSDREIIIFMHHQPVDVGAEFIDILGLENKQDFWDVVSGDSHVRGIFFGHVHQNFKAEYNHIPIISAPSTAMQFRPFSRLLDFDKPAYGFRTLTLNSDGTFRSEYHMIDPVICR